MLASLLEPGARRRPQFRWSESRCPFAIGFIPASVRCLGALFVVPESPGWLLAHGRTEQARRVVLAVAGRELTEQLTQRYRERQREQQSEAARGPVGVRALLTPRARPALIVGLAVAAIQQFGGIRRSPHPRCPSPDGKPESLES